MANNTKPPSIPEHSTTTSTLSNGKHPTSSASCPFCTVISSFPPLNPRVDLDNTNPGWNPDKVSPPSYVLLSTEHVVAFLDIAPLTRGHVLVTPRAHRMKVGDLTPEEMSEIGRLLPLISRCVIKAVLPDIPHKEADYNIVQNNGPGAAQVVPHVHFHIIPRPPLNYKPLPIPTQQTKTSSTTESTASRTKSESERESGSKRKSKYATSKIPTGIQKSYVQFGRGARHELDEDDAAVLVREMRRHIAEEIEVMPESTRLPLRFQIQDTCNHQSRRDKL